MENKTVQYKRTLRGSVGAGVGALFNGNGRRYYILEHREATKYHKAGEPQKIIIDQAELGRDRNCQVRFDDETCPTVSRRHAAIVREGDRWKLVQLSQTNSTFLNGRAIATEWYLENGDEIQLSVGGPRLGFIVPQGKQSLVSSIKISERLELFRKQALRPYKTAIACMFVLILLLAAGSGYVIHSQGVEIADLWKDNNAKKALLARLSKDMENDRRKIDSLKNVKPAVRTVYGGGGSVPEPTVTNIISQVKPSVYAIQTDVYCVVDGKVQETETSIGTGFLTTDGRFITARHCVEPWLYTTGKIWRYYALTKEVDDVTVYADITAVNCENKVIKLKSTSFKVDRSYDSNHSMTFEGDGQEITLTAEIAFGTMASLGNDWAVAYVGQKGAFHNAGAASSSLKAGTSVHMLGFPKTKGIGDGRRNIEPIYNQLKVSRDGLNSSRCIMVNQGVEKGNSGGPVFTIRNNTAYVVGVVSRGDTDSEVYNHLVPMSNIQ